MRKFGIKEVMEKHNPKDTKITELEGQIKRIAADFDNFRKRSELERQTMFQIAQAQTLLELAPVLDNFQRATEHKPIEFQDNKWVMGVLYIQKQLEQIFESHGVTKIKTVGEVFNPSLHEAVSQGPDNTIPANHIINELEAGYTLNGQVLKPAKVKVSSGSDSFVGPESTSDKSKVHEPTAK